MRHRRHHPSLHQAQLAGARRQRSRKSAARSVLCRDHGPSRPRAGRRAQGRPVCNRPRVKGDAAQIRKAVALLASARRPVIYSGGGVINAGPEASKLLRDLVDATGFPITSTLMGLGAYPATGKNWLGMLGMHGTYEANMAMHDCDVMLCIGARFDDRITGRVDAFSPGSKKIHIDIDPSSINKNIRVDVPIIGDAGNVMGDLLQVFKAEAKKPDIKSWWQ